MKAVLIGIACAAITAGCATPNADMNGAPAEQGLASTQLAPGIFRASIRLDAAESETAMQQTLDHRIRELCGGDTLAISYSGGTHARKWDAVAGSAVMLVPDYDRYIVADVACSTR